MLKVFSDGNKVILDLCGRKRDVLLSSVQADELAGSLDQHSLVAEKEPPELIKMEIWNVYVTNYDHKVVMQITPPAGEVVTNRVPMPVGAARQIAELLRTNADMAGYGLQIKTKNTNNKG